MRKMEKAKAICLVEKKEKPGMEYAFWQTYRNLGNKEWKLTYGSNARVNICPSCGKIGFHFNAEKGEYSCGAPETVTARELGKRILNHVRKRLETGGAAEIQCF